MVKDQLFKAYPTNELFNKVISAFGFDDIANTTPFSRNELKYLKTVEKINLLKPYLEKCYIPCKARTYLNNLTEKNVITILRQILKTKGYIVTSKEKYMKGHKFIVYRITEKKLDEYIPVSQPNKKNLDKKDNKEPIIITFN